MKVNSTGSIGAISPQMQGGRAATQQPGADGAGDKVTLSSEAEIMRTTQEDARPPGIRDDVVQDMRTQIANGTFESGVNMDEMLDSLLADM
jgi:hypothetical protein